MLQPVNAEATELRVRTPGHDESIELTTGTNYRNVHTLMPLPHPPLHTPPGKTRQAGYGTHYVVFSKLAEETKRGEGGPTLDVATLRARPKAPQKS